MGQGVLPVQNGTWPTRAGGGHHRVQPHGLAADVDEACVGRVDAVALCMHVFIGSVGEWMGQGFYRGPH